LKNAANPDLQDDRGRSALMMAASSGHRSVVQILVGQGADVNVMDNEGLTASKLALKAGHTDTVEILTTF